MKVVIDPGHGGRDQGAVVGAIREAEVVLPFCFAAGAEIVGRGHEVRFTRMTNTDLAPGIERGWKTRDLRTRTQIANEWEADAFLSFHCNASASHLAEGAWVLHDDNTSVRGGITLAREIFRALSLLPGIADSDSAEEVYPDDSGWTGGRDIYILGATRMPAVLIELGFLTNVDDKTQLILSDTKIEVARAVANGLEAWRSQL